ncbi:MAG: TonB-dependent receptor plug domain-containing protein [Chitinispirillia bacterium]|nr:TonB-dependent receptor plug domain-containing protein [Chitinispirillia bacterium]
MRVLLLLFFMAAIAVSSDNIISVVADDGIITNDEFISDDNILPVMPEVPNVPFVLENNNEPISEEEFIILDLNDLEEMEFVVRHRMAAPLSPSSRTIKAEDFQGKFSDLPSLLETVSGINIRSMGGHGKYAEAAIRGGSARGLRVYLDGVLLTGASTGAVDLSKIPLDRITEIRVTKSTSGLRQMGAGMGGIIELFTNDVTDNASHRRGVRPRSLAPITAAAIESGSFGYVKGGAVIRRPINEKIHRQINIDASSADNDYPFMHDNGTTTPTLRDPDPTYDDTLMRKKNNYYRSVDAAYSLSIDISEDHRVTQQLSAGTFNSGLFNYHYKRDQSGSTDGSSVIYGVDYQGIITDRLTIGSEASGIYRQNRLSDPDARFGFGGSRELESDGQTGNLAVDARYSLSENFYMAALTGTRVERHTQRDITLSRSGPVMRRYEYRAGAEVGFKTGVSDRSAESTPRNDNAGFMTESILRSVYKYEIDTTSAGFDYWSLDGERYTLAYPITEAVVRVDMRPVTLQLSASASKRSPTFFERFGWGSGFLSTPDLREETRMEADIGVSVDMGHTSASAAVFGGRVNDKIKSIPRNRFVKVMNFADTDFYGAEFDVNTKFPRILSAELSGAYLKSVIIDAADPSWTGRIEPFIPEWSGFLKTEADIRKFNIGHGIKYESECYISIENILRKEAQWEFSAWASYKPASYFVLRYRVENYLNRAVFDFLDNPMPRRTHAVSAALNF